MAYTSSIHSNLDSLWAGIFIFSVIVSLSIFTSVFKISKSAKLFEILKWYRLLPCLNSWDWASLYDISAFVYSLMVCIKMSKSVFVNFLIVHRTTNKVRNKNFGLHVNYIYHARIFRTKRRASASGCEGSLISSARYIVQIRTDNKLLVQIPV
jgi:hypothetical protein